MEAVLHLRCWDRRWLCSLLAFGSSALAHGSKQSGLLSPLTFWYVFYIGINGVLLGTANVLIALM
eukprot:scaffold53374_cov72-Cyclotella_meneghiniana.AAC.1